MSNELELRAIERYYLPAEAEILAVENARDCFIVKTADMWWRVNQADLDPWPGAPHGYVLLHVRRGGSSLVDPEGVAVLPDGAMFRLNDPAELDAFITHLGATLSAQEIAALVSRFHHEPVGRARRPLLDAASYTKAFGVDGTSTAWRPFEETRLPDGTRVIDFCTLGYIDLWHEDSAYLVQWHVEVGGLRGISCSAERIGEHTRIQRRAIERYYLPAGAQIVGVKIGGDHALVKTTLFWWRVNRADFHPWPETPHGYVLLEARHEGHSLPEGIAVLPDGSMFHLSDESEFKAFIVRLGATLSAQEIAALVSGYHLEKVGRAFHPLIDAASYAKEFGGDGTSVGWVPLLETRSPDGTRVINFCTFGYVNLLLDRSAYLVRWDIEVGGSQGITWSAERIANLMHLPRVP